MYKSRPRSQSKSEKLKVAVFCGGPSAEHKVSLASGRNVYESLNRDRFAPELLVWEAGCPFPGKKVSFEGFDVVFIALHGSYGEDGRIQAFFDLNHIPYTGSGVAASSLGLDKPLSKTLFQAAGIPTPEFIVVEDMVSGRKAAGRLDFPCVVKPSSQGSSLGVSIVRGREELESALERALVFGDRAVVERFIEGREFSGGILGNSRLSALPLVEIVPKGEFFDYEAKYVLGAAEEISPARLCSRNTREMQSLAMEAFRVLGCRGFGRVDLLLDRFGEAYVLEVNTIPGMTKNSLLPKEAAAAGITFPQLVEQIIDLALEQ